MCTSATPSSAPLSPPSFAQLGLRSPYLLAALRRLGLTQPTEVQCKSLPALLSSSSVLLGAETGCGKTLAYLLPTLDWLLRTSPIAGEDVQHADGSWAPLDRSYPRVLILQPNRELCQQMEAVLESLIGASGSRELPLTDKEGASTRIYYSSLTGTQLFPPPSPALDILITTPSCLVHNLPFHEIARVRAQAIRLERERVWIERGGGLDVESNEEGPRTIALPATPARSPLQHARFDPLALVAGVRVLIMDEVDYLLESGGMDAMTKKLLQQVFMKFERRVEADDEARERRMQNRYGKKKKQGRAGKAAKYDEEVDTWHEDSSAGPSTSALKRQYIFVGATLANISPQSSFQYLLHTFTAPEDRPGSGQSGPISLEPTALPRSCQLQLCLTSHFHHLSPELTQQGVVQWKKVGPETRDLTAREWDPERDLDEERLESIEQAGRSQGKQMSEAEQLEEDARMALAEASAARAAKRKGGRPGDFYFKGKRNRFADEPAEGSSSKRNAFPPRFTDATDVERVEATAEFLNAATPDSLPRDKQGAAAPPPLKSLMFVDTTTRLKTLEAHLRALQTAAEEEASSSSSPRLTPHVQLLCYHAGLKPEERSFVMRAFNSSAPAPSQRLPSSSSADPSAPLVSVPVTHQVLLCTSLVSRGLDFHQIVSPAPLSNARSEQTRPVRPGFTSLIQFDMATNVVEYIHRTGRMFRHRPSGNNGDGEEGENKVEGQKVMTHEQQHKERPRVLNLYSAADELLVSRLRGQADPSASDDASSPAAGDTSLGGAFVPDAVFSRKRRLRHKARKEARRAQLMQQIEEEEEEGEEHQPAEEEHKEA